MTLSDREMDAVQELRGRFKGEMDPDLFDDVYLFLRFLKARDFHLDNAETMLRKHLQWREKHDLKNARKFQKSEFLLQYCPNLILGHDKEGCVIRFAPVGTMDFRGIVSSLKLEEVTKVILYETESETAELEKQSQKLGRNVDRCIYIYDLEHFTFAQATDKKVIYNLIFLVDVFINNYPERLKAAYIFNVPIYFQFLFSMLKPLLPKTVLDKIRIYSDDSYKEDLLKVVDADVLPAYMGGTRTDPDGNPLCLTFIPRGGPVPESMYLSASRRPLSELPGVQKLSLPRASFREVELPVAEAGSFLEWQFETRSRDVGFGLFRQQDGGGVAEIVPIQRLDTDLYPETGTFRCDQPGTYVMVFDNTYSWVRGKEVYLRTELISPEQHQAAQIRN